jgi:transcriptional regulator with XRE-family HTH domain
MTRFSFGDGKGDNDMSRFSEMLKRLRIERGVTLREFCLSKGFDPGNYSRLERGLYPPPSHDLLEKYATALDVVPGSDTWLQLFDLAATARGEIPSDLMADARVVDKLPVLFRTMRATQFSPERLDALIDEIRRS